MNAEQLKALLKSHAEGDEQRFYDIAMQIAADAARQGQGTFAKELRALIDKLQNIEPARPGPIPVTQPRGELSGLLSVTYPTTRLADLVLNLELRQRIERVIHEQRQRRKLEEHGLKPRRKLLLIGPPGSGKTMTAAALATELQLPLFTIVLDGLLTKFMGESAAKLRLIFDAISKTRGVYLFDEFDAIGGHRALPNDVGEIRRVLNSFLLFLEQDASESVIVAATNHPDLLDPALFRRFDDVATYDLPNDKLLIRSFRDRLSLLDASSVDWKKVASAARGFSYADVTKVCEDLVKHAVLSDQTRLKTASIIAGIKERKAFRRP